MHRYLWLLVLASVPTLAQEPAAQPETPSDAVAGQPLDRSVTVYRAPGRGSGSIDLDHLYGFALVSEVRTVHLPAGTRRLRFEGVADGIEPASAIVTGLGSGVIEKNRDGQLLNPAALVAATVGKTVTLLRDNKKTGETLRVPGTIRSDADGVVFETAAGVEALRCSGLPESFSFVGSTGLAATPTLSVLVRSAKPATKTVTLSYLARGFDWAADYTATLSADGKSMDLGAWVTLANSNGVGFPAARTQVVAGKVNRENDEVEPFDLGAPIVAQCWPRGSTSDPPQYLQLQEAAKHGAVRALSMPMSAPAEEDAIQDITVTAQRRVEEEQLGDLKLYRVPERTTVASRQLKQVRLLDRQTIPIAWVYSSDLLVNESGLSAPASLLLRTKNTVANHLGLALPSGHVAVFAQQAGENLLQHEANMRDLAVEEEVEINMGESPDVQIAAEQESSNTAKTHSLPLVRGVSTGHLFEDDDVMHVQISNARATNIQFELRLQLPQGGRVVRADHPMGMKNGRPIFRLTIPAHQTTTLRFQTQNE